jgi:hypothetical protein
LFHGIPPFYHFFLREPRFLGTFTPARRALDRPMAMGKDSTIVPI